MSQPPEMPPPTIVLRRVLPASPDVVFDAWSRPEALKRWMSPYEGVDTDVQMDFRVGGRCRLSMRGPDGPCDITGTYVEIARPHKLVFTWYGPTTSGQATLVTVEFFARDGQTELVLTHEQLPSGEVREAYLQGWPTVLQHLSDAFQR